MTKLTKAEREELRRLHERAADAAWSKRRFADLPLTDCQLAVAARNALPHLLADLDAAEAERDAHKELIDAARYDVGERSFLEDAQNILKECVAAYSCEQMQAVAKALRQWRDKWAILLETVVRTCEDRDDMMAQRDRAESELATLRADRDAALIHLPVCCGSLADAADTLRQERDELAAKLAAAESAHSELFLSGQVAELRGKLAAVVEAAHQSVLIAKDESRGGPCGQSEPGLIINAEVRRRMKSIRVLLTPAIAAARRGAQ